MYTHTYMYMLHTYIRVFVCLCIHTYIHAYKIGWSPCYFKVFFYILNAICLCICFFCIRDIILQEYTHPYVSVSVHMCVFRFASDNRNVFPCGLKIVEIVKTSNKLSFARKRKKKTYNGVSFYTSRY